MRTPLLVLILTLFASSARADLPPHRPEPKRTFTVESGRLVLPSDVVFSATKLDAEASDAALSHVADYLAEKTYITQLRVEAHTEPGENALALTKERALAVARALVAMGVDCKRLVPVAFGADKPIAPNDTPENKARNRRIEFHNAALRGRAIGGMPVDGGGASAGDACK